MNKTKYLLVVFICMAMLYELAKYLYPSSITLGMNSFWSAGFISGYALGLVLNLK